MDQSDLMFVRDVLYGVVTGDKYDVEEVVNALDMVERDIMDVVAVEGESHDNAS